MQPQGMPPASPASMLPSSLLRGNPANAGAIFQQSPLTQNMGNGAMASQGLQQPPPASSQSINQSMPPQPMPGAPQAGQPQTALPGQPEPQVSESQMILEALMKRLESGSKLTHKTADTLISMIQAQLPTPGADPSQGQGPQSTPS